MAAPQELQIPRFAYLYCAISTFRAGLLLPALATGEGWDEGTAWPSPPPSPIFVGGGGKSAAVELGAGQSTRFGRPRPVFIFPSGNLQVGAVVCAVASYQPMEVTL